jgi:four helix bundle protein
VEKVYRGFRDLKVYQLSYSLAMEIFHETKRFPAEERYSLIDQMRRSTRSIPANLAEAWKKRRYERLFISKMTDCAGEAAEVEVWLDFARDCGYFNPDRHHYFHERYEEVSKMLSSMAQQPEKFCF